MCRCQNLVARPLERVGYWNCWKIRKSMTLKFAMVVPCVFFFKCIPLQNESLPMDAPQALPWSPPCSKSSWRSCESKTWCPWGDNVAPNMLQLTMISMVCFAQWVSNDLEAVSLDHWIIIPGLCGFWTLAGQQSHKVYSKTWPQTHSSLLKWYSRFYCLAGWLLKLLLPYLKVDCPRGTRTWFWYHPWLVYGCIALRLHAADCLFFPGCLVLNCEAWHSNPHIWAYL